MTQDSVDGCKAVYVGNLDSRINTAKLADLFPAKDQIRRMKILPDRHVSWLNEELEDLCKTCYNSPFHLPSFC